MSDAIGPIDLPPSVTTDQDKLDCAYRLQQLLIDQFNGTACSLAGAELVGFRQDWEGRLMRLHARLNELRAVVEPPVATEKIDGPEQQARQARKLAARHSEEYDVPLENHPLLTVTAKAAVEIDPLEHFPDYTELDPAPGYITVAANTLTMTTMPMDADRYVYKDFDAAHFADFTHLLRTQASFFSANSTGAAFWAVSNAIDDMFGWYGSNDEALFLMWFKSAGGSVNVYLYDAETHLNDTASGLSLSTDYYPRVTRAGATLTCILYETAARDAGVFDTISVAVNAARTYRYAFPVSSYNNGSANNVSFVSADLDIGEGVARPKVGGSLAAGRAGLVR